MLLLLVGGLVAGVWFTGEPAMARDRFSLLTAWLCFALLVAALGLGPWQALHTGQPVLNNPPALLVLLMLQRLQVLILQMFLDKIPKRKTLIQIRFNH